MTFRDLVILAALLFPSLAQAQQTAADRIALDWRAVTDDAAAVFSAPAGWSAGQWAVAGLVAGAGVLAMTQDEAVQRRAVAFREEHDLDPWMTVGDAYGAGIVNSVAGAALYGGGLAFDDEWTRVTGRMLLQSIAYAGLANLAMKIVLGRARPDTGEDAGSFHFLQFDNAYLSMPSGHCTNAFATSSTLAARIDHPAATAGLYALALLTASQRILDNRHWLSDTMIGSALGVAIGLAVVHLEEQRVLSSPAVPVPAGLRPHQPLLRWGVSF